MMPLRPSTAMAKNHTSMTGPKMVPTNSVPFRCTRNRPTRIAMVMGTTIGARAGASIFRPSTALSTAIAIEQRGADQADHEQGSACAAVRRVPYIEQREQRDNAALAAIVGAQNQD